MRKNTHKSSQSSSPNPQGSGRKKLRVTGAYCASAMLMVTGVAFAIDGSFKEEQQQANIGKTENVSLPGPQLSETDQVPIKPPGLHVKTGDSVELPSASKTKSGARGERSTYKQPKGSGKPITLSDSRARAVATCERERIAENCREWVLQIEESIKKKSSPMNDRSRTVNR